jgi:hypothetical protein
MRLIMNPLLLACASLAQGVVVAAGSSSPQHVDVSSQGYIRKAAAAAVMNDTTQHTMAEKKAAYEKAFPFEELEAERVAKKKRMKERRETAAKHYATLMPNPEQLERVDPAEWQEMEQRNAENNAAAANNNSNEKNRNLASWFSGSGSSSPYSTTVLAEPSTYYDKWAQGYRMLGGFIDCDHGSDGDEHSGDNNDNNDNDEGGACSRWMMWAAVSFVMLLLLLLLDYYGRPMLYYNLLELGLTHT